MVRVPGQVYNLFFVHKWKRWWQPLICPSADNKRCVWPFFPPLFHGVIYNANDCNVQSNYFIWVTQHKTFWYVTYFIGNSTIESQLSYDYTTIQRNDDSAMDRIMTTTTPTGFFYPWRELIFGLKKLFLTPNWLQIGIRWIAIRWLVVSRSATTTLYKHVNSMEKLCIIIVKLLEVRKTPNGASKLLLFTWCFLRLHQSLCHVTLIKTHQVLLSADVKKVLLLKSTTVITKWIEKYKVQTINPWSKQN